jgi:putative transposase
MRAYPFCRREDGKGSTDGRARVVRHGHFPKREVMTGIGPLAARRLRVRDRAVAADDP